MILHIVGGDGSTEITCYVVRFDEVTQGDVHGLRNREVMLV